MGLINLPTFEEYLTESSSPEKEVVQKFKDIVGRLLKTTRYIYDNEYLFNLGAPVGNKNGSVKNFYWFNVWISSLSRSVFANAMKLKPTSKREVGNLVVDKVMDFLDKKLKAVKTIENIQGSIMEQLKYFFGHLYNSKESEFKSFYEELKNFFIENSDYFDEDFINSFERISDDGYRSEKFPDYEKK